MFYSLSLPGARAGADYLLKPDFSKITPSAVAAAMGQSFFSLSLGVGTILTYASYIRRDENILVTGLGTVGFDLLFALIAGFAIMPAVFAAGIEPGAGPGLVFETLPYIFARMGVDIPALGTVIPVLFFIAILVAALSSSISLLEAGVSFLVEEVGMCRKGAIVILTVLCWILGAFCSLSFGPLHNAAGEPGVFNFCDQLVSNFLMPFGSLLFTLFVGWQQDKGAVREELLTGRGDDRRRRRMFPVLYYSIRYVAPLVILAVFLTNLFW
jgi:NSS family neurotransmitter:Na+ symporter